MFPCGHGLAETVLYRSLTVWPMHTYNPIGISYLIDSHYRSSMALLDLIPVCLHALAVREAPRKER